jgi:hypothetical protein
MIDNPKSEQILHYIDKVHNTLSETGKAINYAMYMLVFLSSALLAISIGLIDVDSRDFSMGGFKFSTSIWILIICASWVIGFLYISITAFSIREAELRDTIIRLYESLDYHDLSMDNLDSNPLETPNIFTVILNFNPKSASGKCIYFITEILGLGLIGIFPIVVQLIAAYNLSYAFNLSWLASISILVLSLIELFYLWTRATNQ